MNVISLLFFVAICAASPSTNASTPAESRGESAKPGVLVGPRIMYTVPMEFTPEPGERVDDAILIAASEFSFLLTGMRLAEAIEGFDAQRPVRRSQDTMVIVKVYDAPTRGDWTPSPALVKAWDDIWRRTGSRRQACISDQPDPLTGWVRYYNLCNPDPVATSNFYLMDRVPLADQPRPPTQDYIRGTCRMQERLLEPQGGDYQSCMFSRRTPWGDRFQFRLYGENIRVLTKVETYIQGLLQEWRQPPIGRQEQ